MDKNHFISSLFTLETTRRAGGFHLLCYLPAIASRSIRPELIAEGRRGGRVKAKASALGG